MSLFFFLLLVALTTSIFIVPVKYKHLTASAVLFSAIAALIVFVLPDIQTGEPFVFTITWGFLNNTCIYIDLLSLFFLMLISISAVTSLLFSKNYLAHYTFHKPANEIALHYAAYLWLYFSMAGVIIFQDTFSFLFSWEIMGIASFIIIILDGDKSDKLTTAIQYLVQMHIGFFFLLAGFILVENNASGSGFQALNQYLTSENNLWIFLLFFIGFGMKAGFVPLHTWLPDTHSIAPGNVSGFMSGAVIKMGIYGLIRVISGLQNHLLEIGVMLLCLSIVTGLFGIIMATVQKDIKRLLAYSSIENIGIIGMGLSVGILGKYWDNSVLMVAGYVGALIHTFNHSLFKSALFFSAGLLVKAVGSQNMDVMGGIIKRMPHTSAFFLFGALGICALPPLNGFVSEFILYNGFFTSIGNANLLATGLMVVSIIALALIGGISLIAFGKAFGVAFLGEPRTPESANVREVSKQGWMPLLIPFIIGLFPFVFIKLFGKIAQSGFLFNGVIFTEIIHEYSAIYNNLLLVNGILLLFIIVCWLFRRASLRRHTVEYGPTWGCGYTAITPAQQYTSASFISDFEHLVNPLTRYKRDMKPIDETEIFPEKRRFEGNDNDIIRNQLIIKPLRWLNARIFKLAIFQTGKLQHYVFYALLFMALILVLTYFNVI